jgi:hypothetical protein
LMCFWFDVLFCGVVVLLCCCFIFFQKPNRANKDLFAYFLSTSIRRLPQKKLKKSCGWILRFFLNLKIIQLAKNSKIFNPPSTP